MIVVSCCARVGEARTPREKTQIEQGQSYEESGMVRQRRKPVFSCDYRNKVYVGTRLSWLCDEADLRWFIDC